MRGAIAVAVAGVMVGAPAGLAAGETRYGLLACAAVFAVSAAWALIWRPARSLVLAGAIACAFASGEAVLAVRAWQEAWQPSLRVTFDQVAGAGDSVSAVVTGILTADAAVRDDEVSLRIDVRSLDILAAGEGRQEQGARRGPLTVSGGLIAGVRGALALTAADGWRAGRRVRLPVRLRRPARHLDPGVPDEERALARRGTILVGGVKSATLVEVLARGSPLAETAAAIRAYTRRAVSVHVGRWSPQYAGVVTAILIGDRSGLDQHVERSLQRAGTYHVIAISGGNIAILAAVTLAIFRWAGILGRTAMLTAIVGFLGYGAIVEGGASVDRAIVTAVLYFAARALDHRVEPLQALGVAAAVLIVVDPLAVADAGFLLSFGATAGILLLVTVPRLPRPVSAILSLLMASAAAEAALLPLSAAIFERVTVAGLPLNFAAIPAMAIAQVAGMLVVPVSALSSPVADALGGLAAVATGVLIRSAEASWVPLFSWRVARPAVWCVAGYYGGLLSWILMKRVAVAPEPVHRRARRLALAWTALTGAWIAVAPWTIVTARGDGRLHLTFLDVGQGDAALVQFPRGTAMLVDAGGGGGGGGYDAGERVVGPVMRHLGIRRPDLLVLSHGDLDHVGGAASIIEDSPPAEVWDGVPVPRLRVLADLHRLAVMNRGQWRTVQRGDRTVIDGVEVLVHHPALPEWERQQTRNDDSVVIELRWKDVAVVLAGDIGEEAERAIADRFEPVPIRVLKVPHHGSASSSSDEFLDRVRPTVAVVSVGRGNPFGHPAPALMERYRALGTAVFRTDQDGAISLDTDGSEVSIVSVAGRSARYGSPRSPG